MAERPETDYAVLRGVVGSTLRGLARDQDMSNGCPNRECDGSLELRFDGRTILLFLASDGDSVRAADAELEIWPPFTLDSGGTSARERVDLGLDPEFGRLGGRAVVRVEAVIDTWPKPIDVEVIRGWVLRSAGGDFVAYFNSGDDSRVLFNQLLPHPDTTVRTWLEVVASAPDVEPGVAADGGGT